MKIVLFSDIHFGHHNNEQTFNKKCTEFISFIKEWTDEHLTEDFITIFMGDYYHNRNTINISTLNYAKEGLIELSNIGSRQFMIIGNHDMYYHDRRVVHSIIIPEDASGIEVVDEPLVFENLLLCPWLVKEESIKDLILKYNPEYIFGHFEIPSFKLNAYTRMDGEYNPLDYAGPKRILSGHFHSASESENITYIGNCFSHDFSDANDWENKGFCILDTESNTLERVVWEDAPKFMTKKVSELETLETINSNTTLKLFDDVGIDKKASDKIISELLDNENILNVLFVPKELDVETNNITDDIEYIGNINSIIPSLLETVDTERIKPSKLISIYNSLQID